MKGGGEKERGRVVMLVVMVCMVTDSDGVQVKLVVMGVMLMWMVKGGSELGGVQVMVTMIVVIVLIM